MLTSLIINQLITLMVIGTVSASTLTEVPAPTQIDLSGGRLIQQKSNRLFIVDAAKHRVGCAYSGLVGA
jgi:hypothetical protein